MQRLTRVARTITVASVVAVSGCSSSADRSPSITAPTGAPASGAMSAAAPVTFDCIDQRVSRPYAIYNARGRLSGNQPMSTRVYRPYMGDTVSTRAASPLVSPSKYPGWPQYNVWNVTGGPAVGTNNYYFLLVPKALPGPGGIFPAQLHVHFNKGQYGWIQAIEMCTAQ